MTEFPNTEKRLPDIKPMFQLGIMLNGQTYFNASFASLDDMMDKKIWDATAGILYDTIRKWVQAQEDDGA